MISRLIGNSILIMKYCIAGNIVSEYGNRPPQIRILAPNEDTKTIMQPGKVTDITTFCFSDDADVLEG